MNPQLPVIDLSDKSLIPGSIKWIEMSIDVRKALEDYGSFQLKYNGVSKELKDPVLKAMEELFDLPVEAKKRNVAPKPYTGYMSPNVFSESIGIQDPNVLEKVNEFTQKIRPDDCEANKCTSEAIHKLSEKLAELDVMIRRMIMESFGIDKYLDEHLNSSNYRLRLMKYIAPSNVGANDGADVSTDVGVISNGIANNLHIVDDLADANNIGAGDDSKLGLHSHTDKNLITVLYQHEVEGLEVQTKDHKWIRVKPSPNSFVVLAGDSLYGLMNGRIHVPFHRVRVTEKKKTRYSIGLFSIPRLDYIIESPKELVDDQHPRLFKPFTYFGLMSFYHTEAGRRDRSTLRAYCT